MTTESVLDCSSETVHITNSFSIANFTSLVNEYVKERSDFVADSLHNYLKELLDVTIILDSNEIHRRQIIWSISKILASVDSHSPLAWTALQVLEVLCNAALQENILTHMRRLTPVVSKLTVSAVKEERKVRLLKVLQTLTYGIIIPRPDLFLAPLITTLIDWSKVGKNQSIGQLSLSVLANLLHKNKVVSSTLMQTVNLKQLMNELLLIQSNILCRMEVCKLMFLLEDLIHEKPAEDEILNFIKVTFCTVIEISSIGNKFHLQHSILFFDDMVKRQRINVNTLDKPWFLESVEIIIQMIQTGQDTIDPDSAMLLFKFLDIFIRMKIPSLEPMYPKIMQEAVAWVSKQKRKASEAIKTMYTVLTSQLKFGSSHGFGVTGDDLATVFLPLLDGAPISSNDYSFYTTLLDFLKATLEVETFCVVLKGHLQKEMIKSLLETLPSHINSWDDFATHELHLQMYVSLLDFVNKVVSCDGSWMKFYTCLYGDQRVISVLAVALMSGSSDLKSKILSLICSVGFPGESIGLIAKSMGSCGVKRSSSPDKADASSDLLESSSSSMLLYAEIQKLLRTLKDSIKQEKFQDIATIQILQLYEYKEQVYLDTQKSLIAGLSSATEEKALLEEQIYLSNQVTSHFQKELYHLRPEFDEMRLKYGAALKASDEKETEFTNLKIKMNEEMAACQKVIQSLTETAERQENEIATFQKKLKVLKSELIAKADTIASIEEDNQKLQMDRNEFIEQMKEKKGELEKLSLENANISKEVERLDGELQSKTKQLALLEQDKNEKDKEIQELQRIRDTVFELTGGRKKFF